ncbi:MAG: hypothetical protein AAF533_28525 [Acidobacteriota bacterium]
MARTSLLAGALLGLLLATPASAVRFEVSGTAGAELRLFTGAPLLPGQDAEPQPSLSFQPELRWSSENRRHRFTVVPFFRWDGRDPERTHADLREAWWRWSGKRGSLLIGWNKVFWGVTESRHLIDVINQDDALEDVDREDKLGQPMIELSTDHRWGNLSLYLLPGHRRLAFPGRSGRLRLPVPIVGRDVHESSAGSEHVDAAVRWSHYLGEVDLGVSWFHGHSREPRLLPAPGGLTPRYDLIHQLGIDLQLTKGAWLWKLETLVREGHGRTFTATVAGFERSFYQAVGRGGDIGLLVELLHDDRDATAPPTAFQRDVFVGTRLAFNDTQDTSILLGVIQDLEGSGRTVFVEGERRFGQHGKLELEGRFFGGLAADDPAAVFAADDFVTLRWSLFW